jgi:hypothetical protein
VAAAAFTLAAFGLVGCDSGSPTGPASSPSPLPPGTQYELVGSLCEHVNLDPLTAILPAVTEELADAETPVPNAWVCGATLGASDDEDAQGIFTILLEVYADDAEAEETYDHFYGVNVDMSGAVEVGGAGQKAFQYVVPAFDGEPSVRVLDGNANFITAWGYPVVSENLPTEDAIFEALLEITRATMASLQDA